MAFSRQALFCLFFERTDPRGVRERIRIRKIFSEIELRARKVERDVSRKHSCPTRRHSNSRKAIPSVGNKRRKLAGLCMSFSLFWRCQGCGVHKSCKAKKKLWSSHLRLVVKQKSEPEYFHTFSIQKTKLADDVDVNNQLTSYTFVNS